MVKSYQDLIVWQQAMAFARCVYEETAGFPPDERFGLTAQVRRSAVSVPSNIAEGQGRRSTADFLRCLGIARGSLYEAETQLLLAGQFGWLSGEKAAALLERAAEIGRLLHGLMTSLESPDVAGRRAMRV